MRPCAPRHAASVDAFLARLAALPPRELTDVLRAWRLAPHRAPAWRDAEDAVGDAIARTRRHAALERLRDVVHATVRTAAPYGGLGARDAAAVEYLAGAAIGALLVRDALTPSHARTLRAPFVRAVRAPRTA
jgi:hypothetical protein